MIAANRNRIEMITVRLNSGTEEQFQKILRHVAEGVRLGKCQAQSVRFFRNEQIPNDWAIQLHYQTVENGKKSPLAIRLAEALRSVGLVNHTVWAPHSMNDTAETPSPGMQP